MPKWKSNQNPLRIPCIALCVVSAGAIICSLALAAETRRLNGLLSHQSDGAAETTEPYDTPATKEAEPSEPLPEKEIVYIYDNGEEQADYPLVEGVALNDYDMEKLVIGDKKRRVLYGENGEKRSRFGIDVSAHQGKIDWNAVAADGVEFAFIRAAYRGYETGRIVEDARFADNISGANSAGVDAGVYFFSQAISAEEAVEEAEFVLSLLESTNAGITLPVVFDWEFPDDEDPARTDNVDGETQTACCAAFCKRIREAGYSAAYYATIDTALFRYDMAELSEDALWLAEYSTQTAFPYEYMIWQYSSYGEVDGIEALTDLDIMIEG